MFGLTPRWIGILSMKRKKKYVPNPEHYPLDTCKNFCKFVADNHDLSDIELVDKIYTLTTKDIKAASLLDLVRATRDILGYYAQPGNC